MTIYVGNLSYEATTAELTELFNEHGTTKDVSLPIDRETNRSRGFGFVEMESEDEEDAAIKALDGVEFCGRPLKVNKAMPKGDRPARPAGGRSGGSSFGGRPGGSSFGGGSRGDSRSSGGRSGGSSFGGGSSRSGGDRAPREGGSFGGRGGSSSGGSRRDGGGY